MTDRERLFAHLNRSLATPSERFPTTRYWTRESLLELAAEAPGGTPAALDDLLAWLTELGLHREVVFDGATFHQFDVGVAGAEHDPAPLDLLLAARPAGVVCYFAAIAFHKLTTQPTPHYHVALLGDADDTGEELLFRGGPVKFVAVSRPARRVPGVFRIWRGPRAIFRVTTREQTLIDAIEHDRSCGGPSVVVEAWERAWEWGPLDQARLGGLLVRINDPVTTRRVGAMMAFMDYAPDDALRATLDAARPTAARGPAAVVPLMPGMPYTALNADWQVTVP